MLEPVLDVTGTCRYMVATLSRAVRRTIGSRSDSYDRRAGTSSMDPERRCRIGSAVFVAGVRASPPPGRPTPFEKSIMTLVAAE
jgi:hypothetical protein